MALGKQGWLEQIIRGVVGAWSPDTTSRSALEAQRLPPGRGRARRYVRGMLRESGLLFGTPNLPTLGTEAAGPEEQLFLAVLRVFTRLALDVAACTDAAPGPRPEQVLLLFAALSHQLDAAEDIHRRIERATKQWPLPQKLWLQVEEAVETRALSLASDPYYGLVLHNGAVFADANLFGRVAIAYFSRSRFPREVVERRLLFAAQQKARLVEVLVGLVSAERKPGFPVRRAILRQIDDLRLPDTLAEATREFAEKAFEKAVPMKRLTSGLRSREMKRFVVEQTLLASLVDGRRSPREVEWTQSLGKQLGFTPEQLRVMELEMAEFYQRHRTVVDVFSLSGGAEVMGEEWVDELSTTMKKNYRALLKEVRETGELSKLLARAARGQKLSSDEKAAMREQLINVAKAVPALAIFAAPGGLLLLLALAKVLPFDLLPSSFRDEPDERERPR
jgi:DnaJ-domain-containing protein 1